MKLKILIITLFITLVGISAYFFVSPKIERPSDPVIPNETASENVTMEKEVSKKEAGEMMFQYAGVLHDVTQGKTVTGVNTDGNATGVARSKFEDNAYDLLATFENLPDPQGSDFYEGWIVRRGVKFSVLSTGRAEKVGGVYQNLFQSDQDLTDHNFYVLTIEPDDGNPDPAEHILEGTME